MKGDFKSDPDCRSGMLSNFKTNKNCSFARRLAIIDGKERRYRMVFLNSGNFCFQLATDITAPTSDDEEEDDEEEDEEDAEDEEEPSAPAAAPAPEPKSRKRAAAPKKADPMAAEAEAQPPGDRAKRQRKQVEKY